VFVSTPIEVCEKRDTKGLYEKARKGEIKNFTGISSPFDAPENPDISVNTGELSLQESTQKILDFLLSKIEY
jgi:adenylylsulfate kinase-like enzyme